MQKRPHNYCRKKTPKLQGVVNYTIYWGGGGKVNNFMLSISRSLQDHFVQKFHQIRPNLSQTVTSEAHMCSHVAKGLKKKSKKECNIL